MKEGLAAFLERLVQGLTNAYMVRIGTLILELHKQLTQSPLSVSRKRRLWYFE